MSVTSYQVYSVDTEENIHAERWTNDINIAFGAAREILDKEDVFKVIIEKDKY